MRSTPRYLTVAGFALLLVTSAACGAPTQPSNPSTTPTTPSTAAAAPIDVPLSGMPTGTATLSWNPSTRQITAAVDMYGFTPGSAHAMHLHPGTCADQSQPPSVPFPDLAADAHGVVKQSVSSQPVPAGIPTSSYLNIHLAPMAQLGTPKDVSFTPIACGDVPADTPAGGPVTLTMRFPAKGGTTPAGSSTLRYDAANHTLRVELKVSGLAPNSVHAVHVHSGSCQAQGDVLYGLPDLQANSAGDATGTTTVPNVTSAPPATGWYVNVHFGPMSQILSGNNPTLVFAPILCGDVKG
jgi:Cu/Zn superoxide dismutase